MSIFCSRKFSTPTKSREQCSIGGGGFSGHLRNSVPGDLRGGTVYSQCSDARSCSVKRVRNSVAFVLASTVMCESLLKPRRC